MNIETKNAWYGSWPRYMYAHTITIQAYVYIGTILCASRLIYVTEVTIAVKVTVKRRSFV